MWLGSCRTRSHHPHRAPHRAPHPPLPPLPDVFPPQGEGLCLAVALLHPARHGTEQRGSAGILPLIQRCCKLLLPPSLSPPSIPPPLARCPSFQLPNHRRRGEGPQGLGSSKVRAVAVSRLPVSQDLFVCTSIQYPHIYSQKAGRISESYIFLLCFAVRGYNRAAAPAL